MSKPRKVMHSAYHSRTTEDAHEDRELAAQRAQPKQVSSSGRLQRCNHCREWRVPKKGRCNVCRQQFTPVPLVGLKAAS